MKQNISGSGIEKNSPNSYLAYADNGTLSTNNANVNSSTFQDKKNMMKKLYSTSQNPEYFLVAVTSSCVFHNLRYFR